MNSRVSCRPRKTLEPLRAPEGAVRNWNSRSWQRKCCAVGECAPMSPEDWRCKGASVLKRKPATGVPRKVPFARRQVLFFLRRESPPHQPESIWWIDADLGAAIGAASGSPRASPQLLHQDASAASAAPHREHTCGPSINNWYCPRFSLVKGILPPRSSASLVW